nr:FecR domain-containing protein [Candidatus Brocadiales bacterium]
GWPRHRGADNSTTLFSSGATEITKIGTVLANGQEIPQDGTTAQRTISSVSDTMTFDDGSTVTITNAAGGSYGCFLVQSIRLSDGTLYSIVKVQDDGEIDVQITSGSKFEIVTPSAIVGVRGTQFTVTTTNLGFTTDVSLTNGTVVLMDRDTGNTTTLTGVDTGTVNVPMHTHWHYHVDGTYHSHSHPSLNNAHHGNPAAAKKAAATSTKPNKDDDGDGYTENQGDCDDTDSAINPGTAEIVNNGKDDDCDPSTSDTDADVDGYGANTDCDDSDPNVNPGMAEIPDNGKDDDCNSATPDSSLDIDDDSDGYTENQGDCDDADNSVSPGIAEIPYNGKDDDCSPATLDDDIDGDTYLAATDCNDNDANVNPGATEILDNGIDDDCDPATADSADQAHIDYINDLNNNSEAVRSYIEANLPITDAVYSALINRVEPMLSSDLQWIYEQTANPPSDNALIELIDSGLMLSSDYQAVLEAHVNLSDTVLNAAINDGAIMLSSDYKAVLIYHSPLSEPVLSTLTNSNTTMSSLNYKNVFLANSPGLPQSIIDQITAGNPTAMSSSHRQNVLDANP